MSINRSRLLRQRAQALQAFSNPKVPPDLRSQFKASADKAEAALGLSDALKMKLAQQQEPPATPPNPTPSEENPNS